MRSIYSAEYRAFLQRLKAQRLLRGKTQVEVAKALGKPQSFVSKIEQGERRLDPLELKQLAALYGVSADWLLGKHAKRRTGSTRGSL